MCNRLTSEQTTHMDWQAVDMKLSSPHCTAIKHSTENTHLCTLEGKPRYQLADKWGCSCPLFVLLAPLRWWICFDYIQKVLLNCEMLFGSDSTRTYQVSAESVSVWWSKCCLRRFYVWIKTAISLQNTSLSSKIQDGIYTPYESMKLNIIHSWFQEINSKLGGHLGI